MIDIAVKVIYNINIKAAFNKSKICILTIVKMQLVLLLYNFIQKSRYFFQRSRIGLIIILFCIFFNNF